MSALQYQNRAFDVLAVRGAAYPGSALLSQTLFGTDAAGEICTGVQKLAQRFLLEFLTEKGSLTFLPERGCAFLRLLRLGYLRTEADVAVEFNFAVLEIKQNLTGDEVATTPNDERFQNAVLDSVALDADAMTLNITITSVAGDTREVILPLALVPSPLTQDAIDFGG